MDFKDFFIKTLDRPHYANEDKDGIPPWMRRGRRGTPPAAQPPAQPQPAAQQPERQVSNQTPTAVASAEQQ